MMEFLATNFNLPTIIVGAIVFGGVGWATWHSRRRLQWQLRRLQRLPLIGKNRWARVEHPIGPRPFLE